MAWLKAIVDLEQEGGQEPCVAAIADVIVKYE